MHPKSSATALRAEFLDFFKRNGHEKVKSGPLILANDPSLMFANAGMVQFKDVFTGRETRSYSRATSSQKCIRISGKHNDLEAVGPSPRHQTFFEMLGNFSFGDYFKEEAIVFAWEFLTKTLELPRERLVCTYFEGNEQIPKDDVARELWKKISGFGEERIVGLGVDDNFWQMGDVGPCGPSSEIYFYNGPAVDIASFGQEQTPEGVGWIEIWNLVFMQYERLRTAAGQIETVNLPKPSIDTGAGLERLASVAQGKMSNYDVDILRAPLERVAEIAGKTYRGSMSDDDVSMRVIADHARTTAFLMAEGVIPDRSGAPYVLRRVMRRAIRHGERLGIREPFLHQVALATVDQMGAHYQELKERRALIESMTQAEELRFRETLQRGLGLLDERFAALGAKQATLLSGQDVFTLHDTYGFPPDLTQVICSERGFKADMAGYEEELKQARARSEFKAQSSAVLDVFLQIAAERKAPLRFLGYERDQADATVLALVVAGQKVDTASPGQEVIVVVDQTPFYGEAGGQVGDQGLIHTQGMRLEVTDATRPVDGVIAHHGVLKEGSLKVGDRVSLSIDTERRAQIRRNHSATHLLHWALRQVAGAHAQQKGSLVGPERLRFDFTHNEPLTPEQLERIETLVNQVILENHPVTTEICSMDQARERGAMMIFEEKYGDTVRLLSMGPSTELCGGTHARATGDLGLFKIQTEQGVAAGVRRMVATTGLGSLGYLRELERSLSQAAQAAKTTPAGLVEKLKKLLANQRQLERQIDALQKKLVTGEGGGGQSSLLERAKEIKGAKVLGIQTEVTDRGALRELAEQLRDKLGPAIVLVASESDGKAQLVLVVARSLTDRFKAGALIRPIAEIVGGSGGGRPDMAQAGGANVGELGRAVEAIYEVVEQAG